MPRQRRHAPAGWVYHVINRGVGRQTLFHKPEDYAAFERVLAEVHAEGPHSHPGLAMLSDAPVERPSNWKDFVNEPQTAGELEALRRSVNRGCPFGEAAWREETIRALGLESTVRAPGRPRKGVAAGEAQ